MGHYVNEYLWPLLGDISLDILRSVKLEGMSPNWFDHMHTIETGSIIRLFC